MGPFINQSFSLNTYHKISILSSALFVSLSSVAASQHANDVQDMSDPLAVYTQAGIGNTDNGINIKLGQTYDTGNDATLGMNIIEIKGVLGDAFGWSNEQNEDNDNSIDSLRVRNFGVDLTNGRGSQVDVNVAFTESVGTQGSASYSLIQALPKRGALQLYPLIGLGAAFGETFDSERQNSKQAQERWDLHGTFYVAGLYSKFDVSEKLWLNYNPMYMGTVTGSNEYKESAMQGDDGVILHEAVISYQINPRANIRYFANWTENVHFSDGDHRVEFNYQF